MCLSFFSAFPPPKIRKKKKSQWGLEKNALTQLWLIENAVLKAHLSHTTETRPLKSFLWTVRKSEVWKWERVFSRCMEGTYEGYPTIRECVCVCVLVCGIDVLDRCSSLHRGSESKSVCVRPDRILVLGMWVVLKCMASPWRPLVMSHFWMKAKRPPLKAGLWGFPSERGRGVPVPLHLCVREGRGRGVYLLCPPKLPPARPLSRSGIFSPALSLQTSLEILFQDCELSGKAHSALYVCKKNVNVFRLLPHSKLGGDIQFKWNIPCINY